MNATHLILLAQSNPDIPGTFVIWLSDNLIIWEAFESEALKVIARGHQRYSSKTIMEFLRHHSMLKETSETPWKLNNNHTAYLSRLFAMVHPQHAGLFSFRSVGSDTCH